MEKTQIIAIVLVRDEDLYIENVLNNIGDFCDHIIIADHESHDNTAAIAQNFLNDHGNGNYNLISHPEKSHDLIKNYAGSKSWIFGVDGDELYDKNGLEILRKRLLDGLYDDYWLIFGNVINCITIDYEKSTATGYLAPPCRSMTKLYNFNAISSWNGDCEERLHGGEIVFKQGWDRNSVYYLYKEIEWEQSVFRCLHLCFSVRSSTEKRSEIKLNIRKNIADRNAESLVHKVMYFILGFVGIKKASKLKQEKYMRGDLWELPVDSFFL